jgi:hypothetical protein
MGYCFIEIYLHIVNLHMNLIYSFVFTLQEILACFTFLFVCVCVCVGGTCTTSYIVGFDMDIKSLSLF